MISNAYSSVGERSGIWKRMNLFRPGTSTNAWSFARFDDIVSDNSHWFVSYFYLSELFIHIKVPLSSLRAKIISFIHAQNLYIEIEQKFYFFVPYCCKRMVVLQTFLYFRMMQLFSELFSRRIFGRAPRNSCCTNHSAPYLSLGSICCNDAQH